VFVSSAVDLGESAVRPAAAFLAGRFLEYPIDTEESPFFCFAILLLAVSIELERDRGPWLKQLATWVIEEESITRSTIGVGVGIREPWLFGLTELYHCEHLWRDLTRRILDAPKAPHPQEADEVLRRIANLILVHGVERLT
jgi:hypothetical protein